MRRDVQKFVAECSTCHQIRYLAQSPAGLLQPLPIPELIWEEISIDFIESLPISDGFDNILVVVDCLSKYGHFISLRHLFSSATVVVFVLEVIKLHGIPSAIISDRDSSYEWVLGVV